MRGEIFTRPLQDSISQYQMTSESGDGGSDVNNENARRRLFLAILRAPLCKIRFRKGNDIAMVDVWTSGMD